MSPFSQAIDLLLSPDQWLGQAGFLARLWQHVWITALGVGVAAVVAIPTGIAIGHTRKGGALVVGLVGAVRAIPTLGLITILALWLGIGLESPLIALIVLAAPSVLAGAYAGVAAVDPALVDASRAVGMSEREVILGVELPLALPVLLGGLRAATLQVVSTATLAAYVTDLGLGRYIFAGLKSRDYGLMLAGSLLVIGLAIVAEIVLAWLQRWASRKANPAESTRRPAANATA